MLLKGGLIEQVKSLVWMLCFHVCQYQLMFQWLYIYTLFVPAVDMLPFSTVQLINVYRLLTYCPCRPYNWNATFSVMHLNGLMQDCSISIADALEILQSCTKPLIWYVALLDQAITGFLCAFPDENEDLVFAKFMRAHRCYDLIPTSSKLVVFDTQLKVSRVPVTVLCHYNGVNFLKIPHNRHGRDMGWLLWF